MSDWSSDENILSIYPLRSHSEIFDLEGKKTASVLEPFLPLPTCVLRPILFIWLKIIFIPTIAPFLELKKDAPSSTSENKSRTKSPSGKIWSVEKN